MAYVENFRDLEVYKLCRKLSMELYELSKEFPDEEMYSLTDQVRRSSRSVGAWIAEAWDKRRYEKHFVSKFTDADTEQLETQHWIETARDCTYITQRIYEDMISEHVTLGKRIGAMIQNAEFFCKGH